MVTRLWGQCRPWWLDRCVTVQFQVAACMLKGKDPQSLPMAKREKSKYRLSLSSSHVTMQYFPRTVVAAHPRRDFRKAINPEYCLHLCLRDAPFSVYNGCSVYWTHQHTISSQAISFPNTHTGITSLRITLWTWSTHLYRARSIYKP